MTEIFLQNSCRICLTEESSMLNIFDVVEEFNTKISDMVEKIAGIKIKFLDEYPKLICEECTNELIIAVKFKEKFEKTELVLSSLMSKIILNERDEFHVDQEDEDEEGDERRKLVEILDNPSVEEEQNENIDSKVVVHNFAKLDKKIKSHFNMAKVLNIKVENSDDEIVQNMNEIYEDIEYLETDENIEYIILERLEEDKENDDNQGNETDEEQENGKENAQNSDESLSKMIEYDSVDDESNEEIITNKNSRTKKRKYVSQQMDIRNIKIMRPTIINHNCEVCGAGFTHLINLKRHMTSVHQIEDYVTCQICFIIFNSQEELVTHLKSHEYNDFDDKQKHLDLIEEDADVIDPKKPHKCFYCKKGFVSKSAVKSHTRTHTGEKPFNCSVCSKKFTTIGGLDLHQRRHSGNKPYRCEFCGQRFVESSNLKVHLRTHTGEKPHKCTLCHKSFSRVFLLQIHQRTHTGEKPYTCNTCDKSFAQQGDLSSHKKIHTGERPHRCKHCGKGFIKSGGLTQHMRKHFKQNDEETITKTLNEFIEIDLSDDQTKYISIENLIVDGDKHADDKSDN